MSKNSSAGFVPPTPVPSSTTRQNLRSATSPPSCCATRCKDCQGCCSSGEPVSRRTALHRGLLAAASLLLGSATPKPSSAQTSDPDEACKNCYGAGKIPCELCSGTGFWRALTQNDPNLKYKGVVCPECEGLGSLTCPICLGTGEGNVRGLLRRRKVEPGPGRLLQTN